MARNKTERRPSTIVRDNDVHAAYEEVRAELGEVFYYVSRTFIYEKIQKKTDLCVKTIAYILNHTKKC
jgi:hypothetical protein